MGGSPRGLFACERFTEGRFPVGRFANCPKTHPFALGAQRGERPFAFLANEYRAPRASYAGRVQVLRVLFDVEEHYFLRNPVEDVLCTGIAALAESVIPAKLFRQAAQARYSVGVEDAHV